MVTSQSPFQPSPQPSASNAESPSNRPLQGAGPCLIYQPNVDICDRGAEVVLVIDLPGGTAAGMNVSFEEGVLAVHATVSQRPLPGRQRIQEYGIGDYRRSFRLGDGFDASRIAAVYRRGVLTIHVPRLAAVRPRTVAVRTA